VISILYAISTLNNKKRRTQDPLLKRIDKVITVVAWTLLAVYGAAFLYWLYTELIGS
jgi:magnesium-transporting ATPase (P-type)